MNIFDGFQLQKHHTSYHFFGSKPQPLFFSKADLKVEASSGEREQREEGQETLETHHNVQVNHAILNPIVSYPRTVSRG